MNRLQACWVLAPLVLGAVWAWWMLLGRDFHWMMRNEAGARILPHRIPQKEPKICCFPPKTSKFGSICANIHTPFKRPLIPRSRRVQGGGTLSQAAAAEVAGAIAGSVTEQLTARVGAVAGGTVVGSAAASEPPIASIGAEGAGATAGCQTLPSRHSSGSQGTQKRLANFLVQCPTVHFIDALSKFQPQMIDVAAKFIAEHLPELCGSLSLESVKLAVETIFCAPRMESAYKGQIEKEFGRYGLCWKQDTLHCVPRNCKIAAAHAKQNVIDHLISDTHDRNSLASGLTSEFQFAQGIMSVSNIGNVLSVADNQPNMMV